MDIDGQRRLLDARLLLGGLLILGVGCTIYLFVRPTCFLPFLPGYIRLPPEAAPSLTWLIGSLPALAHVTGFSLITAALLKPGAGATAAAVGTWLGIDLLFECAQHPAVASLGLSHLAGREDLLTAGLVNYLRGGTFDPLDLIAILLGAGLAVLMTNRLRQGGHQR
jgi:hypothetical protein